MKLLSIAIPCYNSEAYMENCIKSLLPGGDEVEILVIDDGSKDRTADNHPSVSFSSSEGSGKTSYEKDTGRSSSRT